MKQEYLSFLIIFLAISLFYCGKAQTISDTYNNTTDNLSLESEIIVYSNSFESLEDTVGWQRNAEIQFSSDVPPDGGEQSIYISGGCIYPQFWIELGPFDEDGFYLLRCWGKDLVIGGGIWIEVEGNYPPLQVGIIINEKEWMRYESEVLFCPSGKKLILSMGAGGFVPSAMLIDKVEIVKIQSANLSWVIRNSGTKENLNDVVMLDSSTAIVVGSGGSVLKTTDSGESWRNTAPQVDCVPITDCLLSWYSVSFFDELNGIVVGDEVIITTDGGEEWSFHNIPEGHKLLCALYLEPGNIYVGDDSGYVHHSADSGKTWTSERLAILPVRSIYRSRFDQEILGSFVLSLYALTPNSLFIKEEYSSDPWKEWGPLEYFQGLGSEAFQGEYSENGTAFIVGVQGDFIPLATIIRLRPPDSHWYSVGPSVEIGELRDLSIPASHKIYLASSKIYPASTVVYTCGTNGKVLKSTNNGDDWISLITPTSQTLNSIYFFDIERGFAVGDSGIILYTSNGGESRVNYPPSPFHLLTPIDEDTMSVMRSITFAWQKAGDLNNDPVHYSLLISGDSGATWNSYGPVTDTTSLQVHSPAQFPGRYFWTVIANDGLLATPSLDVFAFAVYAVADINESEDVPHAFALSQNYPNPFNPTTKIKYSIPTMDSPLSGGTKGGLVHVQLKVYDILGRETVTLVNEEKPAGEFEVEFDADNLSSGIYFYKLQTENYSSTRKMILLR